MADDEAPTCSVITPAVSGDPSYFFFTSPFSRLTFHACIRGIPDTNCLERRREEKEADGELQAWRGRKMPAMDRPG